MMERGKYNDIHPSAQIADDAIISGYCYIAKNVKIGPGTKLGNGVRLNTGVVLGRNCNLQDNVILNSDTIVEDDCFFSISATTADEVFPTVGEQVRKPCYFEQGCVIGMDATVVCSRIGKGSVVGAKSLVRNDIPPKQVWAGIPAKFLYDRATFDNKKSNWEAIVKGIPQSPKK